MEKIIMKTTQSGAKKYLLVSSALFLSVSVMFMTGCVEEPDLTAVRSANQKATGKTPAPLALNNAAADQALALQSDCDKEYLICHKDGASGAYAVILF